MNPDPVSPRPARPRLPAEIPAALGTAAFIGGGNMARCLIGGLVGNGMDASELRVADPDAGIRRALAADFALRTFEDNLAAAAGARTWVLAVKPQAARAVCETLSKATAGARPLVISIMAGVTSSQLARWLGPGATLVRAMPNTPALIGSGVTGLSAGADLPGAQRACVEALFSGVGETVWVEDEAHLDAVTAVSGSGPAYVFLLAEAMARAACAQGLPAASVRTLVSGTVLGAARMLAASGGDAVELRRRVTSPGGTTQAAIETLEAGGLVELVERAIANAAGRSRKLSDMADRA